MFLALVVAEIAGNEESKKVTRPAFWLALLTVSGLTVSGIASGLYDVAALVGGVI